MANMLRKSTGHAFGCCSHCARKAKADAKPQRRERRLARAREKRIVARDFIVAEE